MVNTFRWHYSLLLTALVMAGCNIAPYEQPKPPVTEDRSGVVVPPPAPPPAPAETPPPPPFTGGTYEERAEHALRERLAGSSVQVQRRGTLIKISIPNIRVFSPSGDQVQPAFTGALDGIVAVLREYDRTAIEIKGFTDSTSPSSFEHNQELSRRRAENIGAYLMQRQIAPQRIRTAGYGPRYPVASNATDTGRAQNRRLEIDLTPLR